ncbi:MAG: hypothetical protein RLZZ210_566 [Pseudomonadota bacterium]|jgi:uncharacterized membrane protein (UPF0127 family)
MIIIKNKLSRFAILFSLLSFAGVLSACSKDDIQNIQRNISVEASNANSSSLPSFDTKSIYLYNVQNNKISLNVKIANTRELRELGLMHIKSMPQNDGMLFVFDESDTHCFWMKNTNIPLSIAFIDDDKKIVDVQDMLPNTETPHCSAKKAKYALELNQGWFSRNNMSVGAKLVD